MRLSMQMLEKMASEAKERFESLGLPTRKSESFRYFPIKKFLDCSFTIAPKSEIKHEVQEGTIVFVNGRFSQALSSMPTTLELFSLERAMQTFSSALDRRMRQMLERETNPFVLSNLSEESEGAFLYIPPREILASPLQIIHYITKGGACHPRMHVVMGAGGEAVIEQKIICQTEEAHWINSMVDISVEKNGKLTWVSEPYGKGWLFESVRGSVKRDGALNLYHITEGSMGVRTDIEVDLIEENSETTLRGLCSLREKNQSHVRTFVRHLAPQTRSDQHYKTVLFDRSVASFDGEIYVEPQAQQTNAYQLNNALILSDDAACYSKPNLEIFADDVKASHGATTGQLDKDSLLYLKTRGLTGEAASRLLLRAFAKEILDQVPGGERFENLV
ncbi:MAG: SufD family Fe-S cluster assembly protein [Simkaniaceae bacterium]|nr:SufD family Fe-S cluster assembly protein [Simkaniaceae bacterium]